MNLEKLFEEIYTASNSPQTEEFLESPLDTGSNPPLLLEQIFEQIFKETHLQEAVSISNGVITIVETEEDKLKDDRTLKDFYFNYAIQKIKNNEWNSVQVKNTPNLNILIVPKGIKKWYNSTTDRRQIICIQALPFMLQNMINIKSEQNDETKGKRKVEIVLKGECPNINITVNNQKGNYAAHITIIKRFKQDHHFYSFYLGGLNLKKIS